MKYVCLSLFLWLIPSLVYADDTVVIPKQDADRIAYTLAVKNKIAQDPTLLGRLVLAESALATWEVSDRSQSSSDSFAKTYNELEEKYRDQLKLAESSKNFQLDGKPFKFAELALETVGKIPPVDPNSAAIKRVVGIGTPLGKELIQGTKSEIESMLGPKAQLISQKNLNENNERAQKGLDNLILRIYERSQTDPRYEALASLMISRQVGARPGESAAVIFSRDPVLKNQAVVDGLNAFLRSKLGPKGELTIGIKELEGHLKTVQKDLKMLVEAQRERLLAQKDVNPVSNFLGQPALTAQDIYDYKERQQTYQNFQTTIGTLAQVFRFIDPKVAEVIGKVGGAYLSVAQSIDTFATSAKGGVSFMSGVNLTSDLLSVFNSLLPLFGIGGGPKIEKVILDEVVALRKQVEALRQEMHARFDRIDRSLNQIFQTMLTEFQRLTEKVDRVQADVQTTLVAMSHLEHQLEQFEKLNRKHLDAIVSRQFKDETWGCDDGRDPLLNKPLSAEKYEQCLNTYLRCAVQHATDDLATGLVSASPEPLKVTAEVLQLGFPESWTVNERWLASYAQPEKKFTEGFVNSALWSYCAENYVRLASSRPEMLGQLKIESIEKLLALGNVYAQSIREQRFSAEPGVPPVFRRLLKEYVLATDALTANVHADKLQFRAERAAGYDVLLTGEKGVNQTADPGRGRFAPATIAICAGESLPYTTEPHSLPVNDELRKQVRAQIPAPALILGDLQDPAQLTLCYRNVRWINGSCPKQVGKGETSDKGIKWRTEHQLCLAKLELTIEAKWKNEVVSTVTLTSLAEHPYTLLEHRDMYREVFERGGRNNPGYHYWPDQPNERKTTTFDNGWDMNTFEPLKTGAYLADSVARVWREDGVRLFAAPSVTHKVSKPITDEAEQTLANTRAKLFPFLLDKMGTLAKGASDSLKHVAARQRLLVTFLQRVYPEEFSGNDALRATLFGTEDAILGAENVGAFETVFLDAEMAAKLKARAARLEQVIAKLPATGPLGIEATQKLLRRLNEAQGNQLP